MFMKLNVGDWDDSDPAGCPLFGRCLGQCEPMSDGPKPTRLPVAAARAPSTPRSGRPLLVTLPC